MPAWNCGRVRTCRSKEQNYSGTQQTFFSHSIQGGTFSWGPRTMPRASHFCENSGTHQWRLCLEVRIWAFQGCAHPWVSPYLSLAKEKLENIIFKIQIAKLVYKFISAQIQACRILLKFTNIANVVHFSLGHNNNDHSFWVTAGSLYKRTLFRTLPFPQYWASLYHSNPSCISQTPPSFPMEHHWVPVCTVFGSPYC